MNKKAVGLDLRADGWTVLEVVRRGRTSLDGLEVVNLARGKWEPKATPEARGEMLHAAFRQQKSAGTTVFLSRPAPMGTAYPARAFTTAGKNGFPRRSGGEALPAPGGAGPCL